MIEEEAPSDLAPRETGAGSGMGGALNNQWLGGEALVRVPRRPAIWRFPLWETGSRCTALALTSVFLSGVLLGGGAAMLWKVRRRWLRPVYAPRAASSGS